MQKEDRQKQETKRTANTPPQTPPHWRGGYPLHRPNSPRRRSRSFSFTTRTLFWRAHDDRCNHYPVVLLNKHSYKHRYQHTYKQIKLRTNTGHEKQCLAACCWSELTKKKNRCKVFLYVFQSFWHMGKRKAGSWSTWTPLPGVKPYCLSYIFRAVFLYSTLRKINFASCSSSWLSDKVHSW